MIQAEQISITRNDKHLLSEASLRLNPGELSVIVGPNGAGKSTLLRVLTGDLAPDSGIVKYDDIPMSKIPRDAIARRRGVLGQQTNLSFDFKAEEVVMLGRIPHLSGWETERDRVARDHALEAVEMSPFRTRQYSTLSGGEAQRLHLARVLAQLNLWETDDSDRAPRWLFLDEPTSALDLRHQHSTLKYVKSLTRSHRLGAIAVLHDLNLAMRYADTVYLMSEGRIVAHGDAPTTLNAENISTVYGVTAETINLASHERPLIHIL